MDTQEQRTSAWDQVATGLGWFSIGLGLAELAAPGAIANIIGISDDEHNRGRLRSPLFGLREFAAGIGILSQSDPAPWLWGRVAGDLLDISSLATAFTSETNDRGRLAVAMGAVLGVTALDVLCAQKLGSAAASGNGRRAEAPRTKTSITVNRPPEEVYSFWRDLTNLPQFMQHLESVEMTGGNRSRWQATAPGGKRFEWEAETVQDEPNRLIAWRSVEGSDVSNAGTVRFEPGPGGRGTIVHIEVRYEPPTGLIGSAVAKVLGSGAGQMIDGDLRRFKQIMETGEVVKSDASIHSGMHAARPPEAAPQMA